jgi:hypothetical protein
MQQASSGNFPEQKLESSENSSETSSSGESSRESPAASPAKPPVSARKVIANRSNALRSTGPTSQAGKSRVRWNAVTHGLQIKALFVLAIDGEERAAFFRFLKAFRLDLQPVGMLEEMHVEGAVVAYWLIQRSLRCEGGEIRRSQVKRAGPGGDAFLGSLVSTEAAAIDDHLSIPSGAALNGILRYRTAAHKNLCHHLAEIERLQGSRKGDVPPVNVQIR